MEGPASTLTPKQQNQSLSGKKKKKKAAKGLKKLSLEPPVTTAKSNLFIDNEEREELLNLLLKLPKFIPEKKQINWQVLKEIPKEKRKDYKQPRILLTDEEQLIRKKICFGINSVSSGLEKNELSCVLINNSIAYPLTQHVVDMCLNRKVPVLAVENLRKTLRTSVGIGGAAFGIHKKIEGVKILEDISYLVQNRFLTIWQGNNEQDLEASRNQCTEQIDNEFVDLSQEESVVREENVDCYVYRNQINVRTFVPTGHVNKQINKSKEAPVIDFICLETPETQRKTTYEKTKVKSVKNNPDRLKTSEVIGRNNKRKRKRKNPSRS